MKYVLVGLLLSLTVAFGQELSRSQLTELSSAERKLNSIERDIERLAGNSMRGTEHFANTFNRSNERQQTRFADAQVTLDSLPQNHPDVQAQYTRMADLQTQLAALASDTAADTSARESTAASWESHQASAEYQDNLAFLQTLANLPDYYLDIRGSQFRVTGGFADDEFAATMALVEAWPSYQQRLADLDAFYDNMAANGQRSPLLAERRSAKTRLDLGDMSLQNSSMMGLTRLNAIGPELQARVDEIYTSKNNTEAKGLTFNLGLVLFGKNKETQQLVTENERLGEFLKILMPEQTPLIEQMVAANQAYWQQTADAAMSEILASKTLPEDSYSGADVAEIKASVTQAFGNHEVVGVYLQGNWARETGIKWDNANGRLADYDISTLYGTVLTAHDGDYAIERWVEIQRDHLQGGSLRVWGNFADYNDGFNTATPDVLMPLSLMR